MGENRWFFLIDEIKLTNVEGMKGIEKYPLNTKTIIVAGKIYKWMLKLMDKILRIKSISV